MFAMPTDRPRSGQGTAGLVQTIESADGKRRWLVGNLAPKGVLSLSSNETSGEPADAPGDGWDPGATGVRIAGPSVHIDGARHRAVAKTRVAKRGPGYEEVTVAGAWDVGSGGQARYDWFRFDEDPSAWWVEVELTYPRVEGAELKWLEQVTPLEVELPAADQWTVTRRLFTGEIASYPVAESLDALNNHAANGWVLLRGGDSPAGVSLTTYAPLLSAPAFLPLSLRPAPEGGLVPRLAPFGALWGEQPNHRPRTTLGSGVGEYFTRIGAENVTPTAPAWSGQSVRFLVRVHPHTNANSVAELDARRDGVLIVDDSGAPQLVGPGGPEGPGGP